MVGSYHYARPDLRASFSGGVLEARVFIRAILEAGWNKKTDLLPVLDLEEGHDVNEYVAGFTSWVENDLGVAPVIYSYPHFINSYVRDKSFARYPLWLAAYGDNDDVRESAPPKVAVWGNNWTAHQYSSNGSVPGVAGRCDLNYAPSVEVLYATKRETEKDDWPRPIPKWFWEWAAWKLGGEAWLRPESAPRLIPLWAWRRLRALLRARNK